MSEIKINNSNGVLTVSSLQVAEDFGKRHDNVIRDIETIISIISGGLLKIEETHEKGLKLRVSDYFIETSYQQPQNKQWYKCYEITRDGFSLLVMGFTGKKAIEWKLKYIEAFNSMERQLTEIHSNTDAVIDRILDKKIEIAVNKALDEKLETIVNKAVTEAVSETVKVLAPYMKNPEENISAKNRIMCKKRDYNNGKMFNLPKDIRNKVDDMIISGKYSCQKIADFIEKNTGMTISYMTVSRYMKKYFIHK